MAYYSLAMLTLAVALAEQDPVYDDMVVKFLEQSVQIMEALEASGCYDPEDGFFYDRLTHASGASVPIKVQTLVGVIPALPAISVPARTIERLERLRKRFTRRMEQRGRSQIMDWRVRGTGESRRLLLSIVSPDRLARVRPTLR